MSTTHPWERALLASLVIFSVTCRGTSPQPRSALENRQAQDGALAILDEDAVTRELAARMALLHHTEVTTVGLELHPRQDGTSLGFYLYAYSTFGSWQGERRLAGDLDRIVALVTRAETECRAENEQMQAEAEARAEELEAIAAKTGKPEDQEAATEAIMEAEAIGMSASDCNAWNEYYPEAETATFCNPDVLVLISFTVQQPTGASALEITELGRESKTGCTVTESDHAISIQSGDLDQDGRIEVLWLMADNRLQTVGRGEVQSMTGGVHAGIYDEKLALQADWSTEFEIDYEPERSVISRAWLADRNRDGHPDIIRQRVDFDTYCACGNAAYMASASKHPDGLDDTWVPIHEVNLCNDAPWAARAESKEPQPCPVAGSTVDELFYDSESDTWQ
jgi:hypothetical protein